MRVGAKIAGGVIAAAVSLVATYEGRSLVAVNGKQVELAITNDAPVVTGGE